MNGLSPEAARAANETVVFCAGQVYVSTKKADIAKNQIILREHQAKEYKRVEFGVGKEIPDFTFVDLNGKKTSLFRVSRQIRAARFLEFLVSAVPRRTAVSARSLQAFSGEKL